tara:strand:+ start:648 stop:950 length:303 start_codon:yes stop_codon:yes gene_type:complete
MIMPFKKNKASGVNVLKFTNNADEPVKLILEPWASEYRVDKGVTLDVVVEAGAKVDHNEIDIDYYDRTIVVHAWASLMTVLLDGQEAEEGFSEIEGWKAN